MYGLKEAGILTFNQLVQKLAPSRYEPMPFTPGLALVPLHDFGMKYFPLYLTPPCISSMPSRKPTMTSLSTGPENRQYCSLTFDWHYDEGYVNISMPSYVTGAFKKFNHPAPLRPQHASHRKRSRNDGSGGCRCSG